MDRQKLRKHKTNKTELMAINKSLDKLREQLSGVEIVSGKVTKSSDDFPYIEEHMTVQVAEPKRADPIKKRIHAKERRKEKLEGEIEEVEDFINRMPEGIEKEIFGMVFLDGFSQKEVGETLGYTQSMISKVISNYLKDS